MELASLFNEMPAEFQLQMHTLSPKSLATLDLERSAGLSADSAYGEPENSVLSGEPARASEGYSLTASALPPLRFDNHRYERCSRRELQPAMPSEPRGVRYVCGGTIIRGWLSRSTIRRSIHSHSSFGVREAPVTHRSGFAGMRRVSSVLVLPRFWRCKTYAKALPRKRDTELIMVSFC